ncbi:MAG TPA: amidohydrolase [Thermoanaerobaculia bacterium]|nr:amidohydrolase [Thermoanaerobaculia bacterium]
MRRLVVIRFALGLVLAAAAAATLAGPAPAPAASQPSNPALAPLEAMYPDLEAFYIDLHQTPELSMHEEKTSAKLANRLRKLGYEVTTGVGGTGVVAILKNGKGPTVFLRADMDALPVEERTGLPFASKVTAKDDSGATVPVMHACGHDFHMTALAGAAELLAKAKDRWRGTLFLIGQPGEEKGGGAEKMLKDGLFTRFPKPDFAISLHDKASAPAGKVIVTPGWVFANVDSVDLTIYGRGGHGAYPHTTVDPVVIAARTVVALQTLVARENSPFDPAVVTVGSIHGGLKHNIIPDEVKLQITVRSFKDDVRKRLLDGIARIAKAEAAAAGAQKEPAFAVVETTPSTYNDPALSKRLTAAFSRAFGADSVAEGQPTMGGEDFSEYGRAGVPAVQFEVGAVEAGRFADSQKNGTPLPSLHSSGFFPDRGPTIRRGVASLTVGALELLGKP